MVRDAFFDVGIPNKNPSACSCLVFRMSFEIEKVEEQDLH